MKSEKKQIKYKTFIEIQSKARSLQAKNKNVL